MCLLTIGSAERASACRTHSGAGRAQLHDKLSSDICHAMACAAGPVSYSTWGIRDEGMAVASVGVVDSRSIYRHGVAQALVAGGFHVVESPWFHAIRPSDFVVIFVEARVVLEATLSSCRDHTKIVALAVHGDRRSHGDLLAAGAHAIVDAESSDRVVCLAAELVQDGMSVIPSATCDWIANGSQMGGSVTDEERSWLEQLCAGSTVVDVASGVGRSERTMYRDLHRLYERLGVRGRYEALEQVRQLEL